MSVQSEQIAPADEGLDPALLPFLDEFARLLAEAEWRDIEARERDRAQRNTHRDNPTQKETTA